MFLIRRTGRRTNSAPEGEYSFGRSTRLWREKFQGPNPPITQHGYFATRTIGGKQTYMFEVRFRYDRIVGVWKWIIQQGSTDIISGQAPLLGSAADAVLVTLNSGQVDAILHRQKLAEAEW
jgi:hypothetical protein